MGGVHCVNCLNGAVVASPCVVGLRAVFWRALRVLLMTFLVRHLISPRSPSSILFSLPAMSSVVAEFEIAGTSATLGIAP